MRRLLALVLTVGCCLPTGRALAAGPDGSAYVSQASGFMTKAMSIRDVMAPVVQLASSLPHMEPVEGNYSFVLQNGDFNTAAVTQSGVHNASFVMQTGYQNAAYLQQFGGGHQSFIVQNGMGNIASVTQR